MAVGEGGGGWVCEWQKSKIIAKVKYEFSTTKSRNKCNTSFSSNFEWKIHFLYYFYDSRSTSMSKGQSKGQINKNMILKLRNCVIPHFHWILTGESFYGIMFVIQGDL